MFLCYFPFHQVTTRPFELVHCDIWTSPIESILGYKYYLVILDGFTHFIWTFHLRSKSDTYSSISSFYAYVHTQFVIPIQAIQCDNGRKFNNSLLHSFARDHGIHIRFSYPYTSQKNGNAKIIIRVVNNVMRTLLFQATLPPRYWAEALHAATYLLNRTPTKTLNFSTPYFFLYHTHPSYTQLCVFGYLCYPNTAASMPQKQPLDPPHASFLDIPPIIRDIGA